MSSRERPQEGPDFKEVEEMVERRWWVKESHAAAKALEKHQQDRKKKEVSLYGTLNPQESPGESVRCMSLNPNGMSMWRRKNHKADRLKSILDKYQLDAVNLQEVCINWARYKSSDTLAALLRSCHEPLRNVRSYNKHESDNIGTVQRGGTATILRGPLSQFVKDQGNYPTMLGRWSWYKVEGEPGLSLAS